LYTEGYDEQITLEQSSKAGGAAPSVYNVTNVTSLQDEVSLLDRFRGLWSGKANWAGKPMPIDSVQVLLPEATDDVIEHWKKLGEVIESPAGWVKPL
jgi:hypothetical protein